jgi:hypothetical protein
MLSRTGWNHKASDLATYLPVDATGGNTWPAVDSDGGTVVAELVGVSTANPACCLTSH